MAADQALECSCSNWPYAGTMAGRMRSLKTGRLKVAMSMIENSTLGAEGELRRIFCTKSTTVGPARIARVLPIIRATFFGDVVAILPRSDCSGEILENARVLSKKTTAGKNAD